MKRFLCMLLVAMVFLAMPVITYADAIMGNTFATQNWDRVILLDERNYGRKFSVNSPLGYVMPKEQPGSEKGVPASGSVHKAGKENLTFHNGDIITIESVYPHNGEYWGGMPDSHQFLFPGWVRMDELLLLYEQQDFEEQNKDKFYPYTGGYDAISSAQLLVEWQWPGSDREKRIITNEDTIFHCADIPYAYRDPDGREWGKLAYTGGWVCLSDPQNSEIPAFHPAPPPAKWSPDSIDWTQTKKPVDMPLLIISLASILVVGTGALLKIFGKPNKKDGGTTHV